MAAKTQEKPAPQAAVQSKRPWWAKVPGLGIFVPPVLVADVEDAAANTVGEVIPTNLPGTQLRQSPRAARKGWYAPALSGAPSTTRQAEILNTALIAAPTGNEGIPNGRDTLSKALIAHDPATAYNLRPRVVTSPNVLTCGAVGAGKSSFTKTVFVIRPLTLRGRGVVVFDKKADDDHPEQGEYARTAHRFNSEPIRFTEDGTGTRLNILDRFVAAGGGVQGMYRLLNVVTRVARDDEPLSTWEKKAIRSALARTFADFEGTGRAPTTAHMLPHLGNAADDPAIAGDLSPHARDLLHVAGLSVRWTLEDLLNSYPGLLDGETSPDVDLTSKLTVFDLSQLPDEGSAVPVVMAIANMWLMGRLRHARGDERRVTNVIYEEGWHMIGGPSAALVESNTKLSRALGISNVFNMHKGTTIPRGSKGYAVIQEAQTVHAFRQDRTDDAEWVQQTFNMEPSTVQTLMDLPVGQCIMKISNRPEIRLQHVRSRWEAEVTNTDEAMAAAVQARR